MVITSFVKEFGLTGLLLRGEFEWAIGDWEAEDESALMDPDFLFFLSFLTFTADAPEVPDPAPAPPASGT